MTIMKPRTTPPNSALNPGAQVASVTLRGQGRTMETLWPSNIDGVEAREGGHSTGSQVNSAFKAIFIRLQEILSRILPVSR